MIKYKIISSNGFCLTAYSHIVFHYEAKLSLNSYKSISSKNDACKIFEYLTTCKITSKLIKYTKSTIYYVKASEHSKHN